MPFVKVSYQEGLYDNNQLNSISKNIHQALMEKFKVPEKDYFQIFESHKKQEFYYDNEYLVGSQRTDGQLFIKITCGSGRTITQKKELYRLISENLSSHCDILKQNVFIVLVETPLENWSFGEGMAQV